MAERASEGGQTEEHANGLSNTRGATWSNLVGAGSVRGYYSSAVRKQPPKPQGLSAAQRERLETVARRAAGSAASKAAKWITR